MRAGGEWVSGGGGEAGGGGEGGVHGGLRWGWFEIGIGLKGHGTW